MGPKTDTLLNARYRNNPPPTGIYMHESWITALEVKDSDNKSREQIAELVWEEGRLQMP